VLRAFCPQAFADPESEEANMPTDKKATLHDSKPSFSQLLSMVQDYALVPVGRKQGVNALALKAVKKIKPEWHAPWKMKTVISGHQGWVRALEVEPGNEWFATGSSDATIKVRMRSALQ